MATRIYLPRWDGRQAPVTAGVGAAWDRTTNAWRLLAAVTKGATAPLSTVGTDYTKDAAAAGYNVLTAQFVSAPLAAQTISGSFSAVVRAGESASAADATLQVVIRAVSADGATERGVLYPGHAAALNTTADAIGQEMGTAAATRVFPASTALSSLAVLAGDRLVVEVGARFHGINTGVNAFMQLGDATATADHTLASGATTSLCPWVELSADLTFGPVPVTLTPAVASTAAVAVAAAPGPVTVALAPATAAGAAVGLMATPGVVSVTATPAQGTGVALPVAPAAGLVTVVLLPAEGSGGAVALDPVPGPVAVDLAPAAGVGAATIVASMPGPVAVNLLPSAAAGEAIPLDVTPEAVLVALVAAAGAGEAVAVTPVPHVRGQLMLRPYTGVVVRAAGGTVVRPAAGVVVRP
ncbi:hypothetical protein [Micromonospora sp. NBC_00421]|uniref:hypothetical protein n=1 Tax=Micromonospora sp. NBC_00421 TaxID=2975976 RepID=UPI002E23E840